MCAEHHSCRCGQQTECGGGGQQRNYRMQEWTSTDMICSITTAFVILAMKVKVKLKLPVLCLLDSCVASLVFHKVFAL